MVRPRLPKSYIAKRRKAKRCVKLELLRRKSPLSRPLSAKGGLPKKKDENFGALRIRYESGRERVCTSLPPTPPDVPFGIRRFLKLGCGFSGQAFDKRL